MAGKATFTEVLEIQVAVDKFSKQMDDVCRVYNEKVAKLKPMPGLGKDSGATQAIKDLQKTIETMGKGAGEVFGELATQIAELGTKMESLGTKSKGAGSKMQNSMQAAQREFKAAHGNVKDLGSATDRFFNKLQGNLPELLAQVLRFSIAFKLIFAVIEAPFKLISMYVNAYKEGFKYQETVQERATDIREALLQSVELTKRNADGSLNWAQNVAKAAEAADYASKKILDFAARAALNPEKIEAGLKSMIQSGGLKLVNGDLNQAIEMTGKLLSLMRARGVSDSNQRRFVQEINDLMTGQVKKGNATLQVLGYTVAEWKKIRDEAEKSGNLYSLIESKLAATNQRIDTASERWKDLNNTLEIYKQTLFGAMAKPLFDALLGFLQAAKKYYEQHKEQLLLIATLLGESVARAFMFLTTLEKGSDPLMHILSIMVRLSITAERFADALKSGFDYLNASSDATRAEEAAKRLGEYANGKNPISHKLDAEGVGIQAYNGGYGGFTSRDEAKRALGALFDSGGAAAVRKYAEQYAEQAKQDYGKAKWAADNIRGNYTLRGDARTQAEQEMAYMVAGIGPSRKINASDSFNGYLQIEKFLKNGQTLDPNAGPHPKLSDPLGTADKALKNQISEVEEAQKRLRESTEQQVAERAKSVREGSQEIISSYDEEFNSIFTLVNRMRTLIPSLRKQLEAEGAKPDQLKAFDERVKGYKESLDTMLNGARERMDKGQSDQLIRITKDSQEQEKLLAQGRKAQIQRDRQAELESVKQAAADGLITKSEAMRREMEIQKDSSDEMLRELDVELVAAKNNAAERIKVENQIAKVKDDNARDQAKRQAELHRQEMADALESLARWRNASIELSNTEVKEGQSKVATGRWSSDRANTSEIASLQGLLAQFAMQKQALEAQAKNASSPEEAQKVQKELTDLARAAQDAQGRLDQLVSNNPFDKLYNAFDELIQNVEGANGGFGKMVAVLENLPNIANQIQSVVASFKGPGGVMGGVGNLASSLGAGLKSGSGLGGLLGKGMGALGLGKAIPVVGQVLSVAGPILGMLGGLFGAAAKKIGAEVAKNMDGIMQKYQAGNATLAQTLKALEAERTSAISRLSGKKGGKDQLNQLLPKFDEQIAALKKQQLDIKTKFEESLTVMQQTSDVTQTWIKSWIDVNKQVKEYIDALGSTPEAVANATKFLNLTLEAKRKDLQQQLEEGEKDAISNALALNDLLKERNAIEEEFKQTEFDLLTETSEAKRTSKAVDAGRKLQEARKEKEERLAQLDAEIKVATAKTEMEREIFNLAKDTAALRERSYQIELDQLEQVKQKWWAMQLLLDNTANLTATGGAFPLTGLLTGAGVPGVSTSNQYNIDITVSGDTNDPAGLGRQIGDSVYEALDARARSGRSTF